jgi:hypothetical protein
MKKNTAILNTITKMINFNFNGEIFEVDLKEGDLHDSWNSILNKNDDGFDVNFSWQHTDLDPKPGFEIYPLLDNGDGTFSADHSDYTIIKIVEIIGDKSQYFYDKPYEYNSKLPLRFEVFNANGELQMKTKRLNKASDEVVTQRFRGNLDWYVEAIDSNGARKNLG